MSNNRLLLVLLLSSTPALAEPLTIDAATRDKMSVCSDGKSHYVVLGPHERLITQLYYGDGKQLFVVPVHESGMLTGDHFLDPRHVGKEGNPNFRGLDMRRFSRVEFDAEKKTCAVRCGSRATKLEVLDPAKAKPLLAGATFAPSPRQQVPHALARDEKGRYYYVDRGAAEEKAKSFRLFIGPKGNLKLQKMVNVVSDSEGEMFATKTGSVRFILNKSDTVWVEKGRKEKLTVLQLDENMPLIYNDLGVYAGDRLGTPCDDL